MFSFQFLLNGDDDSWTHSKKVSKYKQGYYKSDDKLSQLYLQVLSQLEGSIKSGNIDLFNEVSVFLELISQTQTGERLKRYFENLNNPLVKRNPVIVCCKGNCCEILEMVLRNEHNVLFNTTNKVGKEILPSDVDEESHNAFYYALKSSNVRLLEVILEKWPNNYFLNHSQEIDPFLSNAHKEIKLRNVDVSFEMDFWVQEKLIDSRFFEDVSVYTQNSEETYEMILERVESIYDAFRLLLNHENSDINIVLYIVKFLSRNIYMLKRQLKSTYDRLPWEEMEFCLVSFVLSYRRDEDINIFYRTVFTKTRVVYHLTNFLPTLHRVIVGLKSVDIQTLKTLPLLSRGKAIESIIEHYDYFQELFDDYTPVRNICSLSIIKRSLEAASSADLATEHGRLVIIRALQITGEHIKDTLESPKLSHSVSESLLLVLSKDTKNILKDLRNSLSHYSSFSGGVISTSDPVIWKDIKNDMTKLTLSIVNIIFKEKKQMIKTVLMKIVYPKERFDLKEIIRDFKIEFIFTSTVEIDEINKIRDLAEELYLIISDKTEEEEFLFLYLKKAIEQEKNKLSRMNEFYQKYIYHFKSIISSILKYNSFSSRDFVPLIANESNDSENNYKIIYTVTLRIMEMIRCRIDDCDEIWRIFIEIVGICFYKIGNVKWLKKLRGQFLADKNKRKKLVKRKRYNPTDCNNETKLEHLKKSLAALNLTVIQKRTDECQLATEMVVLDVLSILKDSMKQVTENPFFMDGDVPLLIGNNLRQHLAHVNCVFETLDCESTMAVILTAQKMLKEDLNRAERSIGKTLKNCPSVSKQTFKDDLYFIINQNEMLESIANGDIENLKETIKKGADLHAKIGLYKWTTLHHAAKHGQIEIFKFIVDQNVSLLLTDIEGRVVLHVAARYGIISMILYCLKCSIDVDILDNCNITPLHLAAGNGHLVATKLLLDKKACIYKTCKRGLSPLVHALRNGHMDIVRLLLSKGARLPDDIDRELNIAVKSDQVQSVNFLISSGANINYKNSDGDTPLILAVSGHHSDMVMWLLTHGASVNLENNEKCLPLHVAVSSELTEVTLVLVSRVANIDAFTDKGHTALHLASQTGNENILDMLIRLGCKVNSKDRRGNTPLHVASFEGHLQVVRTLLNNLADINSENLDGENPFDVALSNGHADVVNVLIEHGSKYDQTRPLGFAPVILAADKGHKEVLNILLDNHLDINKKFAFGKTLLHYAIFSGSADTPEFLIRRKADVHVKDEDGRSPIHYAAFVGDSEIVKLLLNHNVDVNDRDNLGFTPLYSAVVRGYTELVDIFIKSGADVNVISNNRKTLLSYAVFNNRKDILTLLLENRADVNAEAGHALLSAAVIAEGHEIMDILLKHNADIGVTDKMGLTALHRASVFGGEETVELLLKRRATTQIVDYEGNSPLHYAVIGGSVKVVQLLLEAGSEINLKNNKTSTPLLLAVLYGRPEIIKRLRATFSTVLCDFDKRLQTAVLTEIAETLLLKGADVNLKSNHNTTVLHEASKLGITVIVELFLNFKAEIDCFDDTRRTPLHCACNFGHQETALLLIERGAEKNCQDIDCSTPLHMAVNRGLKEVIQMLLNRGANMNICDSYHLTPLNLALFEGFTEIVRIFVQYQKADLGIPALKGHIEIVEMLLDMRYDVNEMTPTFPTSVKDKFGHIIDLIKEGKAVIVENLTPLHYAVIGGQRKMVELLLMKGANVDSRNDRDSTPLHGAAQRGHKDILLQLLKSKACVNLKNKSGDTPLHLAVSSVQEKKEEITEILIASGSDINCKNSFGYTPLIESVRSGNLEVADILISSGAHIDCSDDCGRRAIHYAALYGHCETLRILIEKGAQFDCRDLKELTPLLLACQCGHDRSVLVLLQNKADVNTKCMKDRTALHFSSYLGHIDIVKLLIEYGADVDCSDDEGNSPLHMATQQGFTDVVQHLLSSGATVNAGDNESVTPLHVAAFWGQGKIVEMLIGAGADVNKRDDDSETPLDLATKQGHSSIVKILQI